MYVRDAARTRTRVYSHYVHCCQTQNPERMATSTRAHGVYYTKVIINGLVLPRIDLYRYWKRYQVGGQPKGVGQDWQH
jgi:hypothetical protein